MRLAQILVLMSHPHLLLGQKTGVEQMWPEWELLLPSGLASGIQGPINPRGSPHSWTVLPRKAQRLRLQVRVNHQSLQESATPGPCRLLPTHPYYFITQS